MQIEELIAVKVTLTAIPCFFSQFAIELLAVRYFAARGKRFFVAKDDGVSIFMGLFSVVKWRGGVLDGRHVVLGALSNYGATAHLCHFGNLLCQMTCAIFRVITVNRTSLPLALGNAYYSPFKPTLFSGGCVAAGLDQAFVNDLTKSAIVGIGFVFDPQQLFSAKRGLSILPAHRDKIDKMPRWFVLSSTRHRITVHHGKIRNIWTPITQVR